MAKTVMVRVRLPVEIVAIINRRAKKYPGEMSLSRYISDRITYDVTRKHVRHSGRRG